MIRQDIIAAIATAPGRAGIGIVRVSGRNLGPYIEHLMGGRTLTPRRAALTSFRDARGAPLDEGLALYFPAPHSYTGEDVLELQGHGGPMVLRLLLQRCVELGARVAEPGEFTRRAFLNGKLDLAQAEGVVDLIEATTVQAARSALRSMRGEFSAQVRILTQSVIELRALVEATLDFPDEEVDVLDGAAVRDRLEGVRTSVNLVLNAARRGSLMRDGLNIALAGQPNVGKSSLLNCLAGEDLAIVTDVPGTTRDPIRQVIDISGIPAQIIDTAGLRESRDSVEEMGIARAWTAIQGADAVVNVVDAAAGITHADDAILGRLPQGVPRLRVMNKIDLLGRPPAFESNAGESVVWLSAKTGEGVDLLRTALAALAGGEGATENTFLARERHLVALSGAEDHLRRAAALGEMELVAEELRFAQEHLSAITGEYTADDLLGEIFSRFCIGK